MVMYGAPGWLSRLSIQLTSWFVGSSPTLGSVLTAQSLEPALDSASPPLSAPPPTHTLSLSLSKINKHTKNLSGDVAVCTVYFYVIPYLMAN